MWLVSVWRWVCGDGPENFECQVTETNVFLFFYENPGSRLRGRSHWIRLELPFNFVVVMRPELQHGPGSHKNDFGTPLSKPI